MLLELIRGLFQRRPRTLHDLPLKQRLLAVHIRSTSFG
jgi:hypothetical protein